MDVDPNRAARRPRTVPRHALPWRGALAALLLGLAACTHTPPSTSLQRTSTGRPGTILPTTDIAWLDRTGYGADPGAAAQLASVGRAAFLDAQLKAPPADPPALARQIAALPGLDQSAEQRWRAARAEQQHINNDLKADPEAQRQARDAYNRAGNDAIVQAQRRHLLRALYSTDPLRERMTWFWMNHFSVYSGKANVRWTLADYEERAVRPHAFGAFRDLVLATLTAPAMLEFLDNAQSAAGRVNENYARELMELHTLGVSGGPSGSRYTQQDVQELARILTGVGLNASGQPPKLPPARAALYRRDGLFEFNPARHDFGAKTFLGHRIEGSGFGEVQQAVDILVRDPACARFIAHKLAVYFVADTPPPALVDRMAQTFQRSGGDIAAVLRTLFLAPEFDAALATPEAGRLKDPMRYVVSSLRLAYGERPVANLRPVANWLQQLGEPLYGRVSPDGYPLAEGAWASSGQMVKRFEIARAIGNGGGGLFNGDDGKPAAQTGFPQIANRFYYDQIEPTLGAATRDALAKAASQGEWNTVLLSSPE
ncbi:DUF1800 domain-containing protein [Xylophilus sp.]|uniref:DUF1800 domain-containing protein n=1 Tax=Xylophilus sp. TaxID=2653893 RepID=UPI0013BC4792|nr:DUF1800 domain-containing protein [Xylophilus sp.]KAF1045743.1 MAG: hypothetical protein GAK38_02879 [Xylophilus sp.]